MRDDNFDDYATGLVLPRVKEASSYDSMEIPELEAILGIEDDVKASADARIVLTRSNSPKEHKAWVKHRDPRDTDKEHDAAVKARKGSDKEWDAHLLGMLKKKSSPDDWTELDQLRVELDLAEIKLARAVEYGGAVNTGEAGSPEMPASASGTEAAGRPATTAEEAKQKDTATPQHKAVSSGGMKLKTAVDERAETKDKPPSVQDKVRAVTKKLETEKKSSLAPGAMISMKSLGGVAPKVEGALSKAVRSFGSNPAKSVATNVQKVAAKLTALLGKGPAEKVRSGALREAASKLSPTRGAVGPIKDRILANRYAGYQG